MVLSCVMVDPCQAYLFADKDGIFVRRDLLKTFLDCRKTVFAPVEWILRVSPKYPPAGMLLNMIFLFLSFAAAMIVILIGYRRIVVRTLDRFRKNDIVLNEPTSNPSSIPSEDTNSTAKSHQPVVLNVKTSLSTEESVEGYLQQQSFDDDNVRFVLDNAANVHIINRKDLQIHIR